LIRIRIDGFLVNLKICIKTQKEIEMDWFNGLSDMCGDVVSDLSVTIGGETYSDVLTTVGEALGGGAEMLGKVGDVLTDDVNINLDDAW